MDSICSIITEQLQFSYSLSQEANPTHQLHYHSIYEIYYFIEGDVDYLVEGKLYHPTPHSLILLSPHVFHGVKVNSDRPYRRFTLHFHPDLLDAQRRALLLSAFPGQEKYSRKEVYYENIGKIQLHSFFEALLLLETQPETIMLQLLPSYIEAILAQLTLLCRTHSPVEVEMAASRTITEIISYLNDNLADDITLDQLSQHFCISKHYLNRAFKKAAGTTVFDYLIHKRVIHARQLIINGATASEAALQSGFRDYSVFYRAYRKHIGHSPIEDRSLTR